MTCAGAPGNTNGAYKQQCQVTGTGAVWACNNTAGCTVSGDWVATGANVTVAASGTTVGSRGTINIIPGTGILPVVTDTGTQINIQLPIDTSVTDTRLNAASGADLLVTPASGSGTAYTGCPSGVTPVLSNGMVVHLVPDHSSTGGSTTFNYCGTHAATVKEADGLTNPTSTDFGVNKQVDLWWDCSAASNSGLGCTSGTNDVWRIKVPPLNNPMTSAGDLIVGGASGALTRLAVPGNGTFCPSWSSGTVTWSTCPGAGGGLSSVGLTMPSWFSVGSSPLTANGTIAVTAAGSQTSHQVIGTCGSATSFAPCALVAADIPALSYQAVLTNYSTISGLTGYPSTFPPTNSGDWAGTWQTHAPGYFQTALANYSTISGLTGYPSTFPPTNSGDWAGTWQTHAPSYFQTAITTGTTSQYFRGDLSLATFPTTWAWGSLTGVPTLTNTVFGRSGTVVAQSGDYSAAQISGLAASSWASQTDGSTVTWAIASVLYAQATLTFTAHGGSRTLAITNPVVGGFYTLKLIQDGTGGEGLTLGSGCTWKVSGGGSGAITLSSGANAVDMLAFTYDGTNCYANLNRNFN